MTCIAVHGVASVDPMGLIDRNCVGTLLRTKYVSSVPYGFQKEDIFSFPIIILLELLIAGV